MRPTERDEEADAGYKRRRTEIRPPQVGTFEIGEISTTLALLTCPHLERHGTVTERGSIRAVPLLTSLWSAAREET